MCLALVALMGVFAFPLVWMVSYSLRPVGAPPPVEVELFVPPYAWSNYFRLAQTVPLLQFIANSLRVILLAVPLTVIVASWAGFAISQLPRRVALALVALSVALLLVPAPALWVPRFILFTRLGWIDTLAPLIAPAAMGYNPFYVILFALAFARVSREVYDSARLDGANALQLWYALALPLGRPTVAAITLLTLADYWSNYVDPLLYLRSEGNFTLPVGIKLLEQAFRTNWPLLMAASVTMVAPVVIVFILGQRLFLQRSLGLGSWPK
jgi:multiple sugar transport system permease protein